MQDLRDLYKAYSAVHDTTIQEELDNSKDQITKMNLSKMRDEDLVEVAEEIIEGLFQYGKTLDEAYDVVGSILEQASDNIIGDRKNKILRIAEAFEKAFDTVTNKAERKCEEDFLKYRKAKPLNEKWYNKFSHEVGNAKVHASIIHEDRECVKNGLIEMISEKLDKVGQEDADIDNDGDVDSSDKYLAKRRKAIGKAMKKGVKEQSLYQMPGGSGRLSDYMQGMSSATRNTGGTGPSRPTPTPTPAKAMKGGGVVKKDKMKKEEYVTELSKKTLGSYVKKAAGDAASRSFDHGESEKRQYEPDAADEKETNKLANRQKGIGRAVNKMMKKEETQVAELYKGKHGQSEKEYQDSRSDAGKMVSGDSKGSGADYSSRSMRGTGPQPAGGSKKPTGQGRMTSGAREDLKYRKARMFSKEELEAIQAKVDSWEEGYQRNPEKGEAEAKKSETSGQRAERNVRDRLKTMDPARAEAMKKQMRAVGLDV